MPGDVGPPSTKAVWETCLVATPGVAREPGRITAAAEGAESGGAVKSAVRTGKRALSMEIVSADLRP